MAMQASDRWEAAFRRLRLALRGDLDALDILDRSRARVSDARDALERAAFKSRRRPHARFAPPPAPEVDGPNYFALILDGDGVVSTHKLLARDDDQAVDRAWVHADARAFDVWDGWRFVERFEPAAP